VATVGVLSYQGDFQKHIDLIRATGISARAVRDLDHASGIDALVIPGGESTTIGMLLERFGLMEWIRRRLSEGMPCFGTCAGSILLAADIEGSSQPRIGGLNVSVRRNAYGRQVESFEADLRATEQAPREWDASPVHGVFIRAPMITSAGEDVDVLLAFESHPVLVRQGPLLAATFHPELTRDTRIHDYFIHTVAGL
jgi:5'-phosphate synthase pdxT subunit